MDEALLQDQASAEERRDGEGDGDHEGGLCQVQGRPGQAGDKEEGGGGENGHPAAGEE